MEHRLKCAEHGGSRSLPERPMEGLRSPELMPAENVRIMCPSLTCRKVLAVPTSCRGKTVRCRVCGTNIRVPANRPAAPVKDGSAKAA